MRFAFFYHSLVSDWNHGNAHFLRGVVRELLAQGHEASVYEPEEAWSKTNLLQDHGPEALAAFHRAYPALRSIPYGAGELDLDAVLAESDIVLVHEWNEPELVAALGALRPRYPHVRLFFHDTHHRMISAPEEMRRYDLKNYDGVLAFGEVLRELYARQGWEGRVWTWHEAADTTLFRPLERPRDGDLVWVGNWGDDERTRELDAFLLEPVKALRLKSAVYGVRYPDEALEALDAAGIDYRGWLPNFEVPEAFARFRVTVHVPRGPYVTALPGIPTIRVFEALACGIPLICSPWDDAEGLFCPGRDFLIARAGAEMREMLQAVLDDTSLAQDLAQSGLARIRARHTCAHRVQELLEIAERAGAATSVGATA